MGLDVYFTSEVGPESACTRYRALLPVLALQGAGYRARYSQDWRPSDQHADVFCFQRVATRASVDLFEALGEEGKRTIYDLDDNVFQIPEDNPLARQRAENPQFLANQIRALRSASLVTTTTETLARLFRVFNPNVRVIPNYIDLSAWKALPTIRFADKIVLGWAGSPTHANSLNLLRKVLPELLKAHPSLFCVFMGMPPPFFLDLSRHAVWGHSTYQNFQMVLSSFDIGLAPLSDNAFNRGKSPLRILELACAGTPMVASRVGEYALASQLGGIAVPNTEPEWYHALNLLITDEEYRRSLAGYVRANVAEWDIHTRVQEWVNALSL